MKKIIDAHIHLSNIQSFKETAQLLSKVDYSLAGVQAEMEAANIVLAIGMGVTETPKMGFPDYEANTPMGLDLGDTLPRTIVYCAGINPYKLGTAAIAELEREIQKDNVVGIKIYLGYYPFYAYDQVYDLVYELAEKYDLPVVFHSGDTYSERGLLKYSHPLAIDEVAVKYRKIRFMMAHFGDPWTLTGAEILYKNRNVYADLSGLVVGARKELEQAQQGIFLQHLRHALVYSNSYDKLLFGTDWPLAPFGPYIEFIQNLIPEMYHEDVFYNTALKVFPKIKKFL
ncbi:amidohydrolase family protein [Niallia taxi]|uniref:amidohydrolase family protein n=1 Tax=Niallia taxi TaxID=2499688 RepID=UPI00203F02EE|nr:TatD family hydrolase [Niallia taxi]MCM3215615.1 amidohydrolase family protein [Niallia taxi]